MIRIWHILVFLLALGAFLVARAPVSLVARQEPGVFTYAQAEGSIWDAKLVDTRLGGLAAGDVQSRVSLLGLFLGKMDASVRTTGPQVSGEAQLLANLGGDRRIVVPTLRVVGAPLGPGVLLAGETTLDGLDVFFDQGRCAAARGSIQSDILARNAGILQWQGPQLVGQAQCVGESAEIAGSGADETGRYAFRLILHPDGRGEWRLEVATPKAETLAMLAPLGFQPDAAVGGVVLRRDLRWFPF